MDNATNRRMAELKNTPGAHRAQCSFLQQRHNGKSTSEKQPAAVAQNSNGVNCTMETIIRFYAHTQQKCCCIAVPAHGSLSICAHMRSILHVLQNVKHHKKTKFERSAHTVDRKIERQNKIDSIKCHQQQKQCEEHGTARYVSKHTGYKWHGGQLGVMRIFGVLAVGTWTVYDFRKDHVIFWDIDIDRNCFSEGKFGLAIQSSFYFHSIEWRESNDFDRVESMAFPHQVK